MLFEGWPHKLLPYSLEEDETKKEKPHRKPKKPEKLLEKQKQLKKHWKN